MLLRSARRSIDVLPDELVVDILARLPAKQVGICKCVSKSWRSTIRSRPFRDTYRRNNPGLLFNHRPSEDKLRLRFFHCPLRRAGEPPANFSLLTEFDSSPRKVTELVDGLLCSYADFKFDVKTARGLFFGDRSSVDGLTLHNICTGEKMRIPDPPKYADTHSIFNLGYDGGSGVYKLLRFIFLRRELTGVHIMTLSPPSGPPSTWRELTITDCGLPSDHLIGLMRARACTEDGLLCWIRCGKSVVWFDLNREKFRIVELLHDLKDKIEFLAITRLKDRFALWVSSRHSNGNVVYCYVQEDNEGKIWRISKVIEVSQRFVFVAGIVSSSSSYGDMLGVNRDDEGRAISYSRQTEHEEEDVFFVGTIPGEDHSFDTCCPHIFRSNSRMSCLGDANNLYMSLDDILGGGL